MWFRLRYTASRGRDAWPAILSLYRVLRPWRILFLSGLLSMTSFRPPLRSGLAHLLLDHLVHVPDPLPLVRLRRTQRADLGGDLPYLLTVDARHRDFRLLLHRHRDPFGDREDDGVRVAERELDVLSLDVGAIADSLDVEVARPSGRDALDRVG